MSLSKKNYLYTGVVGHRRFTPFNHFFKYPLFMAYIDLNTVNSFLKKLWRLFYDDQTWIVDDSYPSKEMLKTIHSTIKKVTHDIESFSFNTCISSLMICVNELQILKCRSRGILEKLVILLSPFAPHISEEIWQRLGNMNSISEVNYPLFDNKYDIDLKTSLKLLICVKVFAEYIKSMLPCFFFNFWANL